MKLIPWAKPKITIQDRKILNNALRSEWISHGSYVEKFEKKLKNFLKVKYASSVSNGTAALIVSLSLGLKEDEILCQVIVTWLLQMFTQMFLNIKFIDVEKSFCLSSAVLKKM